MAFGGIWRQRGFRLFWFGESVNHIGNSLSVVVLSLLTVSVLDATAFEVGLLTGLTFLPWLLIGLQAGAWVDRLPAKNVMIVSDLVAAGCFATVPLAAWLDLLSIEQVLVVAFVSGTASVFFETAYHVTLPTVVDTGDLMEANAKLRGTASVAQLSGLGLGGFLAQAIGAATALSVNAASFLVSAACLLRIRAHRVATTTKPAPAEPLRRSIAAGIGFVAKDPYLRPITIWAALSNFGLTGHDALIMLFLVRDVGVGPGLAGILLACGGIGAVIGAMLARRIAARLGTARGLLVCTLVLSPPILLVPLATPGAGVVCYALGMLLCCTGIAITNIIVSSFRQSYTPAGMLGRVTATVRFLLNGSYPLGALVAALLGTWLGVRAALWLMLGLVAVAGVILLTRTLLAPRDLPQVADRVPVAS
ncbi:MFS transporter [Nocardia sp. NPDC127579]|uniref:MFS transporter n=1 Tax=Nocardia sp. NPDC127579 TaxID=3345402 RepID=UPI003634AC35